MPQLASRISPAIAEEVTLILTLTLTRAVTLTLTLTPTLGQGDGRARARLGARRVRDLIRTRQERLLGKRATAPCVLVGLHMLLAMP